jgi:hypothetical protein
MLILFCIRGCGRIERPAFPAPSDWRGREVLSKTRAYHAARPRRCVREQRCLKLNSVAAITRPRHSGAAHRAEPGISRFRVRCFASLAMTLWVSWLFEKLEMFRHRRCAPSPLVGEGWGEGLFHPRVLMMRWDRYPLPARKMLATSPRKRGEVKNKRRRCLKIELVATYWVRTHPTPRRPGERRDPYAAAYR